MQFKQGEDGEEEMESEEELASDEELVVESKKIFGEFTLFSLCFVS